MIIIKLFLTLFLFAFYLHRFVDLIKDIIPFLISSFGMFCFFGVFHH
nr:MAG TPA: hypothetical protein [Bacteriophage sp.]DAO41365.1 MAG TPA: hypothetical protein [Caudoviricetes sp.]